LKLGTTLNEGKGKNKLDYVFVLISDTIYTDVTEGVHMININHFEEIFGKMLTLWRISKVLNR